MHGTHENGHENGDGEMVWGMGALGRWDCSKNRAVPLTGPLAATSISLEQNNNVPNITSVAIPVDGHIKSCSLGPGGLTVWLG